MNVSPKLKLNLTAVLIHDQNLGGFTSYIAEFPEAVAEGDTKEQAIENVFDALVSMIEFRKEESTHNDEESEDTSIFTKSFELELS